MKWNSRWLWLGTIQVLLTVLVISTAAPVYAEGFFESLFGGPRSQPSPPPIIMKQRVVRPRSEVRIESSRAPAPRRNSSRETAASAVVVVGDGMADWLASGLEDAFSEIPQISVERRISLDSGLIKYAEKTDENWSQAARNMLSKEKPDYIVVMLGLSDRQDIREKSTKEVVSSNTQMKLESDKAKGGSSPETATPDETQNIKPSGALSFRSEGWTKAYAKRIDDMGAAAKSKGVPVLWVGLPPVRGSRSMSDLAFLNGLYRTRAEHAGITYVDVWDGFVDDDGKYSTEGPDFEGQTRRLRSNDGIFFTKFGARKLAHYVERELRRYINGTSSAILSSKIPNTTDTHEQSVDRPLSGPIFPLTAPAVNSDELLGAGRTNPGDAGGISERVLKKGEPLAAPPGRADNFSWPVTAVETTRSKAGPRDIMAKRTSKN